VPAVIYPPGATTIFYNPLDTLRRPDLLAAFLCPPPAVDFRPCRPPSATAATAAEEEILAANHVVAVADIAATVNTVRRCAWSAVHGRLPAVGGGGQGRRLWLALHLAGVQLLLRLLVLWTAPLRLLSKLVTIMRLTS